MGILRYTDALPGSHAPVDNGMVPDEGNSFSRGLSQGSAEASGQLRALLARGAETLGAKDFAKEQYAKVKEAELEAAASAPAIDDIHKIGGLRDLGSYLAGQTGRMAPTLAAALAGAALTRGTFTGATAGVMPLTTGAEIQRQEANPVTANMSMTDRNLSALGAGTTQAVLGNAVPMAMGGKLLGQFAKQGGTIAERALAAQAAKEAAGKNIVARNLAEGVAGNAAAGAAGEFVNQAADTHYDPTRDKGEDNQKMIDAGLTGAVTGVPFAGAGMLGDRIHGTRPAVKPKADGTMPNVVDRLKTFMGGDVADVERSDSKAPIDLTPQEEINTLFDPPKKDKAKDIVRAEAEGQPLQAELPIDATPESAAMADEAKRREHDTELFRTTADIIDKGNGSPELKSMYELMDVQGRSVLKNPEFRQKLGAELAKHLDENDAIEKANDAIAELGDEGKYSVDSRVAAYRNKPLLPLFARHIKDFASRTPEAQTAMSEALMRIARRASDEGELPAPLVKYMDSLTDGNGSALLASMASGSFDGAAKEKIFRAANKMMSEERRMSTLQNTLANALPDEIRSQYSPSDLNDLASRMRRLIGEVGTSEDNSHQTTFNKNMLYGKMKETFGDKYDSVIEAFTKDAADRAAETRMTPADRTDTTRAAKDTQAQENGGSEDGTTTFNESNPQDKQPTHDAAGNAIQYMDKPIYYEKSKDKKNPFTLTDDAHKSLYPDDKEGSQTRMMKQAEEKAKNSGHVVSWMTAKEYAQENGISKEKLHEMTGGKPDDYGLAVAERTRSDSALSPEDVNNMRVGDYSSGERGAAKTSHYNNATTFYAEVGGKKVAFDGSRVASYMARKEGKALQHTEKDNALGSTYRTVRSFIEGIAALSDYFGTKIEPPDSTAIINSKGKHLTYGDAKEVMKLSNHPDVKAAAKLIDMQSERSRLVLDMKTAEAAMREGGSGADALAAITTKLEGEIDALDINMNDVKNGVDRQVTRLVKQQDKLKERLKDAKRGGKDAAVVARLEDGVRALDTEIDIARNGVSERVARLVKQQDRLRAQLKGEGNPETKRDLAKLVSEANSELTPEVKGEIVRLVDSLKDEINPNAYEPLANLTKDLKGTLTDERRVQIQEAIKSLDSETDPKIRDAIVTEMHAIDGKIGTESLYKERDRLIKALDSTTDETVSAKLERSLKNIDERIKHANLGEQLEEEKATRSDMQDYKEGAADGGITTVNAKHDTELEDPVNPKKRAGLSDPDDALDRRALEQLQVTANTFKNKGEKVPDYLKDRIEKKGLEEKLNSIGREQKRTTAEIAEAKKEIRSPVVLKRTAAEKKLTELTAYKNVLDQRIKELESRQIKADGDNGMGLREIAPEAEIHLAAADLGEEGVARKVDFSGAPLDYNRNPRKPISPKVREWNRSKIDGDEEQFTKFKDSLVDADTNQLAQIVFNFSNDKTLKGNERATVIIERANLLIRADIARDGTVAYGLQLEPHSAFITGAKPDREKPTALWRKSDADAEKARLESEDRLAAFDAMYGDGKPSDMKKGTGVVGRVERDAVEKYVEKVLGKSVDVMWSKSIGAAGLFNSEGLNKSGRPLIELSVHALNPMTVAYHEAMHGFMHSLMTNGLPEVRQTLLKAANSPVVMSQLRKLLKDEPDALKSMLNDPEERVAYMHQFWADNKLTLGGEARSIFQKVADAIKDMLGIWSNDKRAGMIMDYFQTGQYAQAMSDPNVVSKALMKEGTNKIVSKIAQGEVSKSLGKFGDSIIGIGAQRLRDMNIPAVTKIAELVRSRSIDSNTDVGYITASGVERRRRINGLMDKLYDATPEQVTAAFNKMQLKDMNRTPLERQIIKHIDDTLADTRQYMEKAGIDVGIRDANAEYTPVMWDMAKVADNQEAVLNMLRKYENHPDMPATPEQILSNLMRNEGSELDATIMPGNQHIKRRELWFIEPADRQPFIETDPYKVINSYINQATKRAEWAKRFGDKNGRLEMLKEQAKKEGATAEQIGIIDKYIAGITGTLGADVSPNWRKLSANMMVYQNVRLLTLGVFSAAVDPMGLVVNGGTMKDAGHAFLQGIKDVPRGFKEMPKADARYKLAEDMGTIENAVLQHRLGASFGGLNAAGGFARRVNEGLFKYNLMEQFNTSMRVAATEAAMKFLARHAEGNADRHSMRRLQELGLTPSDIIIKDGRPLVRASEFEAHGMNKKEAQAASNKMAMAVNKWVDGSVLRPDASQKAIWMNDPHYALIAHMKQFSFAFQETMLKRVAHEAEHGNYEAALGMASYIPVMLAADMTKGMLQGGGSQPDWKDGWTAGDYLGSAFERAGLLGVKQFGVDAIREIKHGGSGLGALGPTVGQLADAVSLAGGHGEFTSVGINALPANTLWKGWMAGSGDGGTPFEPIAE